MAAATNPNLSGLDEFCSTAGLDAVVIGRRLASLVAWHGERPIEVDHAGDYNPSDSAIVTQWVVGDPGDAIVSLRRTGEIEVAEYSVRWDGHVPVVVRRVDVAITVATVLDGADRSREVRAAIAAVTRRRRRRFRRCVACDVRVPPEWWFGDGHCQSCAQRDLGVVF